MISIIVVFPKLEEAKSIKNLLVRNGFDVMAACTTAAQVIHLADDLDSGIVVSGYKLADMMYSEMKEYLPDAFDMLLLASKRYYSECDSEDIVCLPMPVKTAEILETLWEMYDKLYEERKKKRAKPAVRTKEEQEIIIRAKGMLMDKRGMTEEEAHKYIQKKSMDNGTNLVETAHMILDVF